MTSYKPHSYSYSETASLIESLQEQIKKLELELQWNKRIVKIFVESAVVDEYGSPIYFEHVDLRVAYESWKILHDENEKE